MASRASSLGALIALALPSSGSALAQPSVAPQPAYTLTASRWYIPIGAPVSIRFRAVATADGHRAPVQGAIVALSSHRARTDRTGVATLRLRGERRHPLRARLIVGGRTRAHALLVVG